jgi:cysteine synthase
VLLPAASKHKSAAASLGEQRSPIATATGFGVAAWEGTGRTDPPKPRDWLRQAIRALESESARSADTHLLRLALPAFPGIDLYFKDEASHPSGSLKHRLARSLYLYALCNGKLQAGQRAVDASSGSTAISEAWFARHLGIEFAAVLPAATSPAKLSTLRRLGARLELVDRPSDATARAREIASDGACYLDQFGLAERATDWRGNNNIAESILTQLSREPHPEPTWIVCGAGTGGTSATIGRYLRYRGLDTRLCVAEPAGGAFAAGWRCRDTAAVASRTTLIEGIGRPAVEAGFVFDVADAVVEVEDRDSISGAWLLEELLGLRYGGSSGTNLVACLQLAEAMRARGERGAIVSLLCDRGERYADTIYDVEWLTQRGLAVASAVSMLRSRSGLP